MNELWKQLQRTIKTCHNAINLPFQSILVNDTKHQIPPRNKGSIEHHKLGPNRGMWNLASMARLSESPIWSVIYHKSSENLMTAIESSPECRPFLRVTKTVVTCQQTLWPRRELFFISQRSWVTTLVKKRLLPACFQKGKNHYHHTPTSCQRTNMFKWLCENVVVCVLRLFNGRHFKWESTLVQVFVPKFAFQFNMKCNDSSIRPREQPLGRGFRCESWTKHAQDLRSTEKHLQKTFQSFHCISQWDSKTRTQLPRSLNLNSEDFKRLSNKIDLSFGCHEWMVSDGSTIMITCSRYK